MKRGMAFIIIICLGLAILTSCGTLLMSNREVENKLQKRYGIPFKVIDAQRISSEHFDADVLAAKVYEVIPQDDPDSPFWAYNAISWGVGIPELGSGLFDTYGLDQAERILTDALEMAGFNVSVIHRTSPFRDMDEKFFSGLYILIDVYQEDVPLACETVSLALQELIDETALTSESDIPAYVQFNYREEGWEADQFCPVDFALFDWSTWSEEEERYVWGPIDFSAEALEKRILYEVGFCRWKKNHG